MSHDRLQLFTGNANPALSHEIAQHLNIVLGACTVRQFADGEIHLQIQENVRGADVFVIQPTCTPVERNLMELLLMMHALKRGLGGAHHGSVTLLWVRPAGPEGQTAGADFGQTGGRAAGNRRRGPRADAGFARRADSGIFRYPGGSSVRLAGDDRVFPGAEPSGCDGGFAGRRRRGAGAGVRQAAESSPLAIIDKRREEANVAEVMNVVGDVEGRHCLLVDDLIDTAGTLVKGAEALIEKGAASVSACATHAVLSGPAVERIEASGLKEVVFTNSIPLAEEARRSSRIKSLSVAHLLAEAIRSIHEETSVSVLFI